MCSEDNPSVSLEALCVLWDYVFMGLSLTPQDCCFPLLSGLSKDKCTSALQLSVLGDGFYKTSKVESCLRDLSEFQFC